MKKIIEVKGCSNCPFCHWEADNSESNHSGCSVCRKADREIAWDNKNPRTPRWCPLKGR